MYCVLSSLKDSIPFAVVGSNVLIEIKGRRVRGRAYPWGVVEGMNMAACLSNDFSINISSRSTFQSVSRLKT